MYVLCDIEWATNEQEFICLTQLSASKVNEKWETIDSYTSLIRPQNTSFEKWDQVCYAGASIQDFKRAPTSYTVLSEFEQWLSDDDIVLWWYEDSHKTYHSIHNLIFRTDPPFKHITLLDYIPSYLLDGKLHHANPYRLAQKRDIPVPHNKHVSKNDVITMQRLLTGIKFPQRLLLEPPQPIPESKAFTETDYPYQYDEDSKLLHKRGCEAIPEGHKLVGHIKLEKCIRKKLRPCPLCLAGEMKTVKREMNREMLSRTQYIYVYSPTSSIFHRYDCGLILSADEILGCGYYKTALNTDRTPCKVCNPTEEDELHPRLSDNVRNNAGKKKKIAKRDLDRHEKRAVARYTRASAERKAAIASGFSSEEEKRDVYVLTQPEFSFWAGNGYSTFHLRHCPKLVGVTNLRGFKQFSSARKAGFTPCKQCKPSPKHDTAISIPINNRVRKGETVEDIRKLCSEQGYYSVYNGHFLTIETPVGHWRINTQTQPIQVDHKNVALSGANASYHRQHREFLSLTDTFRYIDRHDKNLMSSQSSTNESDDET